MAYCEVLVLQAEFRCPRTQVRTRGSTVFLPVVLHLGKQGREDLWGSLVCKST